MVRKSKGGKTKGVMIAICGLDGSGKTSVVKKLLAELGRRGINVHHVKEPHISMIKHFFRLYEDPYIDTLLFAVDRLILQRNIGDMLKDSIVVSERSIWDGICYQGADGISWDTILKVNRADQQFRFPDIVLILDAKPEQAYSRILFSTHRKFKDKWETRSYLERVREQFLKLYKYRNKFPGRFYLIDSTGALKDAYEKTEKIVLEFLKLK